MKKGNKVVLALFDSRASVESAVNSLRVANFRREDISVLMPSSSTIGHEKGTKAPEGAIVGTGTGAVIGGTLGWLVGIGAIAAFPALGPLIAAGPILSALTGAAVGGAVGSLTGALVGLGVPEYEAKRYETFVKTGGFLASVHVDDREWERKAMEILDLAGGHDIATTTESAVETAPEDQNKDSRTPPLSNIDPAQTIRPLFM